MPRLSAHSLKPDIAIIGGGIIGLWASYYAGRAGANKLLIEKRAIGGGASGGVLGALMPHQPVRFDAKKRFQLEGLLSLSAEIAAIEAATGLSAGYRRCGRLMPIRTEAKRTLAKEWVDGAHETWPEDHAWTIDDDPGMPSWLSPDAAPFGVNRDTLSARVDPRALLATLKAAVHSMANVTICENTAVKALAPDQLMLQDGTVIKPGRSIVCAGYEGFPLMETVWPRNGGRGVKGQTAVLKPLAPVDPASPILYDNGTYVIAHENGTVAIGSTSENSFSDPVSTDEQLEILLDDARALCPALEGAAVIERWAGVRPRAAGRDPVIGPLPGAPDVIVATGGFKITFAIAHLMASRAVQLALGENADLPEAFLPMITTG